MEPSLLLLRFLGLPAGGAPFVVLPSGQEVGEAWGLQRQLMKLRP